MPKRKRRPRNYKISDRTKRINLVKNFFRLVSLGLGCPSPITDAERRKEETLVDALATKLTFGMDNLNEDEIVVIVDDYMLNLFDTKPQVFTGSIITIMANWLIIPYRSRLTAIRKKEAERKDELAAHLSLHGVIRRIDDA